MFAENISKEKAFDIANRFFQTSSRGTGNVSLQHIEINEYIASRSSTNPPSYYIFNNSKGNGFVIVAGDDKVVPILGYSLKNNFPQMNIPCNVEAWLKEMDEQIAYISKNNIINPDDGDGDMDIGEVEVDLSTPQWDQGEPYNNLCPTFDGKTTPSGCVMTAAAIVMRYHQWPQRGHGTIPGYTTRTYMYTFPERELGHVYDWDNMPYQYESYNQKQADEIATLMFDLGMMLEADYAPDGTGAYTHQIPEVLQTYMDYDKNADTYWRNDFSDSEWDQLLKEELSNNRPIIYGGFDRAMSGGHAFILDGYTSKNYYSVNWGWSGVYNGYFLLSALEPTGQGTGGNGSNFNYNQSAIIGLKKNEEQTERLKFIGREDGLNGFLTSETNFSKGVPFTISAGVITNSGTKDFTGTLMLGLTNDKGVIKEELMSHDVVNLKPNQGYTFVDVQCVISGTINKGDCIKAFYKNEEDKDWIQIKGDENCNAELSVFEYTIDESTTIIYKKEDRSLHIETKKGVCVEFMKEDGTNLNHLCVLEDNGVMISAQNLTRGIYIVRLSKGNEMRNVKILLGNIE